eukprot:1155566-Pelagomonas_calceolata.AAC.2
MMCKVTLFLFGFFELRALVIVPACQVDAASRVEEGLVSGQDSNSSRWMSLSWGGILVGSSWADRPGIERTKTASGRLWNRVEEPVPSGKTQ